MANKRKCTDISVSCLQPCCKNLIAHMLCSADEDESALMRILKRADLEIPKTTCYRWKNNSKRRGSAIKRAKHHDLSCSSNKPKSYSSQQKSLLAGYVSDKIENNRRVNGVDAHEWARSSIGVQCALRTTQRVIKELGFSPKYVRQKTGGYSQLSEDRAPVLQAFIRDVARPKFKNYPLAMIASMDFTYDQHRKDCGRGYGYRGGGQPRDKEGNSSYTSCIVTCWWVDGKDRTPPVLFTFNTQCQTEQQWRHPTAGRVRTMTKRRREKVQFLKRTLAEFGLEDFQCQYVEHRNGKCYCAESKDIVRRWYELYQHRLPPQCCIFRDCGQAYSGICDDLVSKGVIGEFVEYPSSVHEVISPNDNDLHAAPKQRWRTSTDWRCTDLRSPLRLVKELQSHASDEISKCFRRNFFLLQDCQPTLAQCKTAVGAYGGLQEDDHAFFDNCRRLYKDWKAGKTSRRFRVQPTTPSSLSDTLDGDHWTSFCFRP